MGFELLVYGTQIGREFECDGVKWMLLAEIRNACHLAVRVDDPCPRQVFFIHVTEDDENKVRDASTKIEQYVSDGEAFVIDNSSMEHCAPIDYARPDRVFARASF